MCLRSFERDYDFHIHVTSFEIVMIVVTNIHCLHAEETQTDKANPDILPVGVQACHGNIVQYYCRELDLSYVFFLSYLKKTNTTISVPSV